ncbi:M23 family metallopeptidase [Mesorhizobium muleiense]|uniref:M23 family metallopeptidase n=1 Tax=Mesorhizobium muleiense TaxID=1004279 RepID=UPI001F1BB3F6|nr:M23 family metallopeptidase [Mesorhizobium muleiense]MCF6112219.1 M23 family metallopeptidase [Mesorhizobium muleiense]
MLTLRSFFITALAALLTGPLVEQGLATDLEDLDRLETVFSYYQLGRHVPTKSGYSYVNPRRVVHRNLVQPMKIDPARGEDMYCNSQVYGFGGSGGPGASGGTSSSLNYRFPWTSDICEKRGRRGDTIICTEGTKEHEGQDCRPPKPLNSHYTAVAVEPGTVTSLLNDPNKTLVFRGDSGTIWQYLHMANRTARDTRVPAGGKLGMVSNISGTSIHLHFEAVVSVNRVRRKVDPLPALIVARQRAAGNDVQIDSNGDLVFDSRFEVREGQSGIGGSTVPTTCGGAASLPSIGTERTFTFSSVWCHNGSLVGLVKNGAGRQFVYYKPRAELAQFVRDEPVLFSGTSDNVSYRGVVRHYSSRCGDQLFDAEGPIASNFQHVVLTGRRKVFNQANHPDGTPDCGFTYATETLQFSYVAEFVPPDPGTEPADVDPPSSDSMTMQPQQLDPSCAGVTLAPMPRAVREREFSSIWFHNCSIIGLQAGPNGHRTLVYVRPKSSLREAVDRNPVFFQGKLDRARYEGETISFSSVCGDRFYGVAGPVVADGLGISLRGDRPRFDVETNCRPLPSVAECHRVDVAAFTLEEALKRPLLGMACDAAPAGDDPLDDGTIMLSASCQPKSVCSNNFGALTPKVEPEEYVIKGYSYILNWPSVLINKEFRDSNGNGFVIPGFRSRTAGSGIWWYWMRRRAGFNEDANVTFRKIAKLYAGIDNDSDPSVLNYANAYRSFSRHYFGRQVGLDESIPLSNRANLFPLAQVMFHHEAGRRVTEIDEATFSKGLELAEQFMRKE